MNKHELIKAITRRAGDTQVKAELHLNALLAVLRDEMKKGGCVVLTGWGAFRVKDYAARTGHNPQTGEVIHIPAGRRVVFTPGKAFQFDTPAS